MPVSSLCQRDIGTERIAAASRNSVEFMKSEEGMAHFLLGRGRASASVIVFMLFVSARHGPLNRIVDCSRRDVAIKMSEWSDRLRFGYAWRGGAASLMRACDRAAIGQKPYPMFCLKSSA